MSVKKSQLLADCVRVPDNAQAYLLSDLLATAGIGSEIEYEALVTFLMLDVRSANSKLWVGSGDNTGEDHYGPMLYADQITITLVTVNSAPGEGIYLATNNAAGVTVGVTISWHLFGR